MPTTLRIDADDGALTRYPAAFRNRMVFSSIGPGHDVIDRIGPDAVRDVVLGAVGAGGIDYVTASGHGDYGEFRGSDGKPVWDHTSQLDQLAGCIVHLLACECGASLGTRMVAAGAVAFWGYTVEFQWVYRTNPPADLADDDVAADFFQMDMIIDRGILAGKPAAEIRDSIDAYVAAVISRLSRAERALLLSNYVHLAWPGASWGDPTVTVGSGR